MGSFGVDGQNSDLIWVLAKIQDLSLGVPHSSINPTRWRTDFVGQSSNFGFAGSRVRATVGMEGFMFGNSSKSVRAVRV